jgi:hypothetical protein
MMHIDGYKVKGLKGQIMTFQESKKKKNKKNSHTVFKELIWFKNHLFYFFKWKLMLYFYLFHIEQTVFKVAIKTELILPKVQK